MQEVCGPSPRFSDDDGDGDWLAEIEMTLDSTLEWMVGKNLKSSRFLLHLPYSTIDDVLPWPTTVHVVLVVIFKYPPPPPPLPHCNCSGGTPANTYRLVKSNSTKLQ